MTLTRSPWPWAIALAGVITIAVTWLAADGISAGDSNEYAASMIAVVLGPIILAALFLGAIRALAAPANGPRWRYTQPVQVGVLTVCAIISAFTMGELFAMIGLLTSAAAIGTALHRHQNVLPWLVALMASTTTLAAAYPRHSDYYDLSAPAARFQDSSLPAIVSVVATVATVAAMASWAARHRV